MELKDFISKTLVEICEGISAAKKPQIIMLLLHNT
jgi:hypothetical protein